MECTKMCKIFKKKKNLLFKYSFFYYYYYTQRNKNLINLNTFNCMIYSPVMITKLRELHLISKIIYKYLH